MNTVRIGLAGFGTVGGSVYRNLQQNHSLLSARYGIKPVVTAVFRRDLRHNRKGPPRSLLAHSLPDLVSSPKTDIIVEAMGGCDAARRLVLAALRAGKPVVTANKALLAEHGPEIFSEAARCGTPIFFEASVAGGIPIIQSLRDGLAVNRFDLIYGIVNGTCNYILSRMSREKLSFQDALDQAQSCGYAEANPSFDIDGIDSAHKASVLASLAHGGCVNFKKVHCEGIRNLSATDICFAHQLGYEIKLLAIIRPSSGRVEVRVHPTLIPQSSHLASIQGVTNAIVVRGHVVGDVEFSGPGAGGDATSSAVIADIIRASSHFLQSPQALPETLLSPKGPAVIPIGEVVSRYYLRLSVSDRPGVLARISSILGQSHIGISSVIQPEGHEGRSVPLILMIHDARNDAMTKALRKIRLLDCVKARPILIRVETFES